MIEYVLLQIFYAVLAVGIPTIQNGEGWFYSKAFSHFLEDLTRLLPSIQPESTYHTSTKGKKLPKS